MYAKNVYNLGKAEPDGAGRVERRSAKDVS